MQAQFITCANVWLFFLLQISVFMGAFTIKVANATPRTIAIALSTPISTFTPQSYGANTMLAQSLIYEGLVELDKFGNIVPSLAASWSISSDGKTYTFSLRKGTRFSNGEAFDARAVLLNFTAILQNKQAHSWVGLIHAIDSIKELDSYTIALVLKYPYALTLNELAFVRPFRFHSPSELQRDPAKALPIGTGAYMLDSSSPSAVTFRKNPYYTDRQSGKVPYFDTIVARIIFDPSAKLAALKAKQIDVLYGQDLISLDMFNAIAQGRDTSLRIYTSSPIFTIALALNPRTKALELASARKALMQALDSSVLVSSVYGDLASPATSFYVKNTSLLQALHFPAPPAHQCDLAHPITQSAPLELIFISNNPSQKKLAQIIQAQAKTCGISIAIKGIEPSAYANRLIANAFDLAFTQTWGAPYEPLSHLYSMQEQGHIEYGLLQSILQKDVIYMHINNAIHATNEQQLHKNLNAALDLLAQSYILLPLVHKRNVAIARSGIKGIEENMGVLVADLPIAKWYQ
ncbi:ABC transporter substrate-binding protein [Helicobacter sp.]|uniref:ABC transporter substrate-binding protein n=1 Tax=Helicobacter sp. TaxID=218 RepID=UPI0025B8B271|nr:ABC transporter substrate-binding protein [Helicobacter sp.]MBR2495615.1 nickel ABC transporter, nickel/metallophore periplasmic binding protein [Helicobacter sp.]